MYVKIIDHMGDDLSVVNAARVSFAKESAAQDNKYTDVKYDSWLSSIPVLKESDKKLINYLGKHNHWSPFGHCQLQFRIKAPVFVARQLVKHQVGLTWNEISRRYVDIEPEFYTPEVWRGVAENKKQGSSDEEININPVTGSGPMMVDDYQQALQGCKWTYEQLLRLGVAPEQARMGLPQSMMTEWYWSGTLYAFARVCNLRCKDDAQFETRIIANQIDEHARRLFPVSWNALAR